eukprot:TRINITY_DN1631_c0_g1_i5.p1 TRINITY_DN1631_c0_g1~~TRINITY_DN1631_c0_g1_i5.p1  ORF type:complete len:246 (-),score=36.12 TRINITY_DN1631_c0_g1_i5:59-796(-)
MSDNPFGEVPAATNGSDFGFTAVPSINDSLPPSGDSVGDAIFAGLDDSAEVDSIPAPAGFAPLGNEQKLQSEPLSPPQKQPAQQNAWQPHGEMTTQGSLAENKKTTEPAPIQEDAPFYRLDFWRSFFDVDTVDVVARGMHAALPFTKSFNETVADKPDMWGPIWICNTLIFACALCGNMASYLSSDSDDIWQYDFKKLTLAAVMIYGYCSIIPLCLHLALRIMGEAIPSLTSLSLIHISEPTRPY